jgi:hypothetical protein
LITKTLTLIEGSSSTQDLYKHLEHGYAATVYKTQGVTVDRSYLLASRHLDAHATYVGMSRHRESVDLFYSREVFPRMDALVQTLSRQRGKDVSTDYLNENQQQYFAKGRGVEPHQNTDADTRIQDFKAQFEAEHPERARQLATGNRFDSNPDASPSTHKTKESERQSELRHLSLSEFKAKFERENPERAAQLRYELLPPHEKAAIAHEKHQKDEAIKLEKALEQQKIAENTQKELARQKTWEISRDNDFELGM